MPFAVLVLLASCVYCLLAIVAALRYPRVRKLRDYPRGARMSILKPLGWEDFMLGRIAAESGFLVGFSSYVVEHRIGTQNFPQNFAHRLRWARTNSRSRAAGNIGQLFTHPLPLAAFACSVLPALWPLAVVAVALRAILAWTVCGIVLRAPVAWLLLPFQDFLAFGFWIAGFFGSSVHWRGQCYTLNRDGTVMFTP